MVRSSATTVDAYLAELPEERRAVVSALRELILRHLPDGYRESMNWGMISYEIPLERYPDTYNGQPLGYLALASQKNYLALYLLGVYQDAGQRGKLEEAFRAEGKRLDMGKSCLRFRELDDLPLDTIAELVAATPPEDYIRVYEESRRR